MESGAKSEKMNPSLPVAEQNPKIIVTSHA
jgi:hypothetical protein